MQVYTNVSAPDRKFILILSELSICLLYFRPHAVPHCAVDDDVVADNSYLIQRLQTPRQPTQPRILRDKGTT